jgi:hypothetical protein
MLSQLAQATFFNINVFTADHWGSYSVTVILGLLFILIFCLLHFWLGIDLRQQSNLLVLVAIFYLLPTLAFFWRTSQTLSSDLNSLKQTPSQVLTQTFCQMDEAQRIGGVYCGLAQYLAEVAKLIPAQAKVSLSVYLGISAYSHYFLYPHFQLLKDPAQSDYLVVFLPEQPAKLSDQGDLLIGKPGSEINYGRWQVLQFYNPQIIIFKRL